MEWEFIIALAVAIPIILFPAAFVWYLNVGGIHATVREAKARRIAREKSIAGGDGIEKLQFTRDKER